MTNETLYLGRNIFANGSYRKEIWPRITNTWITVRKLGVLWKKALVSLKWKLRVYDAVIISKLLYGLEAIQFTEQGCKQFDIFQYRGQTNLRHQTFKNKDVLLTANTKARNEGKQKIIPISQRPINRQIQLYGHLVKADEDDLIKKATMYQDGTRRKSLSKKWGNQNKNGTQSRGNAQSNHWSNNKLFYLIGIYTWETQNLTTSLFKQPLTESFGKLLARGNKNIPTLKHTPTPNKVLQGGPVRGSQSPLRRPRTRVIHKSPTGCPYAGQLKVQFIAKSLCQ